MKRWPGSMMDPMDSVRKPERKSGWLASRPAPTQTLCLDAQERWELKQKQMRDSRHEKRYFRCWSAFLVDSEVYVWGSS